VRAGQWLSTGGKSLCVVSRDRFALALIDVLRQQHAHPDGIRHYTHMDLCFENLHQRQFLQRAWVEVEHVDNVWTGN